jgi:hypothetical protein
MFVMGIYLAYVYMFVMGIYLAYVYMFVMGIYLAYVYICEVRKRQMGGQLTI